VSFDVPEEDIALYLTEKQLKGARIRFRNKYGIAWGHTTIATLARMGSQGLFTGIVENNRLQAIRAVDPERTLQALNAFLGQYGTHLLSWSDIRAHRRKFCDGCKRDLKKSLFTKKAAADGLDHRCIYCRHREEALEAERNQNLRRIRELHAEGSHTVKQWLEVLKKFGFRCVCCRKHASEVGTLTQDHIVPLVSNGSDFISNIQPLCKSCNSRKGTKTIDYRDNFLNSSSAVSPNDELPDGRSSGKG
jgi:5-methylcytosine-specific restriction endonuclease McrA